MDDPAFEQFVTEARPRLRRAFLGTRGPDGAEEAVAEAMVHAWERWSELRVMDNPVGYLFRVGQSRTRQRRTPKLPTPEALGLPDVEPALVPALLTLSPQQRTAVWLVHACGWHYREAAEAMEITTTAVGTHVARALDSLRRQMEVTTDA